MDGVSAGKLDRNVAETAHATLRNARSIHESLAAGARTVEKGTVDPTRVLASARSAGSQVDSGGGKPARPPRAELERAAEFVNRAFSSKGIRFEIDESGSDIVVQVVDLQSDKVVRTIPPDRLNELQQHLDEFGTGVLLDDRA